MTEPVYASSAAPRPAILDRFKLRRRQGAIPIRPYRLTRFEGN